LNTAWLLWGIFFSAAGLGIFIYGKRQKALIALVCGLVLMICPYFITNLVVLVVIGILLMILPWYVRV
jgi:hypothetical protein